MLQWRSRLRIVKWPAIDKVSWSVDQSGHHMMVADVWKKCYSLAPSTRLMASHTTIFVQVRLGMGACARAVCCCVHFPPVLQAPGASVWPSPRQMPGPSPSPWDADQPAATTRHVVRPLATPTHEAPSLRDSREQDQRRENEPHVPTAAADAHRLCREQISFESLSATARWTQCPTSDSQGFSEETWYQRN